ncbi:hypothetical protein G9A89_009971 [Geosiphon pyriformis]|nr:hypothetical protein G9A89_009971 [Geosiphon pyriformis]
MLGVTCETAAYFFEIDLSVGVRVQGLLSSMLAELQAIAVALECVLLFCSVVIYSNNITVSILSVMFAELCAMSCEKLVLVQVSWPAHFFIALIGSVLHSDSHMLMGFTSRKSAALHTYLMKAVYGRLSVAVCKRLYDIGYSSVLCLMCDDIKFSEHAFTCSVDLFLRSEIVASHIEL